MPLTDGDGLLLGALCAIGHAPRSWDPAELADLEDLAAACSAELRQRILSAQLRSAQKVLETARAAAERARGEAESLRREAQTGLDHAELLLKTSEELAQTSGLDDVRRRLHDLLAGVGKPSYAGLLVADRNELRRIPDPDDVSSVEREISPCRRMPRSPAPGPCGKAERSSCRTARRSSPPTAPMPSVSSTGWASRP
ncbi:hypothetical protein [Streptomyces sp. NPDC055912]|uniref:hypothetical protein n=1 Tax=Streptomyces sp. NPDC055912 TaxID=3345660 RepID=UPI0035DBE9CE